MKNIFRIIAAALLVAGCVQREQMEPAGDGQSPVFTASFEDAPTKTYLDSGHKLLWTADDRLSIFINTYNQQYRFMGETGDNSGAFKKIDSGEFVTGNTMSTNYAVYPYLEGTKISNEEVITVDLPAVQAYAEGSFGPGANTMVAVTSSPDDYFLPFRNLCGYLVVKLYGEGTVRSICLKGNGSERIAGTATVVARYGDDPETTMSQTAADCITVDCGEEGVTLGATASEATEFWFCIPPVTFSEGFTVTATNMEGWSMVKTVSSEKTVTRNVINWMPELEAVFSPVIPVPEMIDLGLPSGLKWASFNVGATKPEEYGDYYAWGEVKPYYMEGNSQSTSSGIWNINKEQGYCWNSYKWCNGICASGTTDWYGDTYPGNTGGALTKYNVNPSFGVVDNNVVLESDDDVAYTTYGKGWRIPTQQDFIELQDNCTWETIEENGVKGRVFTSKKNGRSIFLPYAGHRYGTFSALTKSDGYYWSSSLYTSSPDRSFVFYCGSADVSAQYRYSRFFGHPVRPVYDENSIPSEGKQYDTFTGVIESSGGYTKVSISESDYNIRWSTSDSIIVTNMGKEGNCAYHLQFGAGTQSATFLTSGSPSFTGDDTLVGLFDLPAIDDMSYMWLSNQEYHEGDNVYTPMTATRDGDTRLTFRPAGSVLYLKIIGAGVVSSIDISADEAMCGPVSIDRNAELSLSGQGIKTIHLDCGSGVGLDANEYSVFKISLLPNEYHNMTVTVTGKSGKQVVKQSTKSIPIVKGTISIIGLGDLDLTVPVPEMVDLGLPSGLKWATCNLGASKPEEYGGYYQWGGLENVTDTSIYIDWSNCSYHTGSSSSSGWTKYIPSNKSSYWSGQGDPDNKTVLDSGDDVAHVKLGGNWRIPTEAEFQELIDNCQCDWVTYKGVNGRKFTSKKVGYTDKWIFLPSAGFYNNDNLGNVGSGGYYWSSSLYTGFPTCACIMSSYPDMVFTSYNYRCYGQSVRPVSE